MFFCPICLNESKLENINVCKSCGHIFMNHPKINLQDYYTKSYRQENLGGRPELDTVIIKKRNEFRLSMIEEYIKDKQSVLEVGFGHGDFYNLFNHKYPKKLYHCCEIDSNLAESAKVRGITCYNASFQEAETKQKYDVVISFDVLEHFYDPYEYKTKLLKVLKDGGIAVIQIPTDRALNYKKPFDGHYHYFSERSLTYLMQPEFEKSMFIKTSRGQSANGPEFLTIFTKNDTM